MQKYITRKNLLILNIILATVLAVTVFFGIVWPLLGAKESEQKKQFDLPKDIVKIATKRLERTAYDVITTNDLFIYKGPEETKPVTPTQYYDLTKYWELTGVINYPDGMHALIREKERPDMTNKLPYTIYDVKVGDPPLISDLKNKTYNVEILEITKEYVKYYRHDMEDKTEEERTFILKPW